ncbi:hypothetical protein XELAEV_18032865mg [Xenopus laevis]|uniref:Uncharacterized protein n=1 Tax=Xenopus laevis TaxID=8355 RepID=A0A974CIC1_XENLA|nr:hypothetical protein XELAEV_18032865mg [Xenopus laevis]
MTYTLCKCPDNGLVSCNKCFSAKEWYQCLLAILKNQYITIHTYNPPNNAPVHPNFLSVIQDCPKKLFFTFAALSIEEKDKNILYPAIALL